MASALKKRISAKIGQIMTEGVRSNTHAPVSSTNERRKVPVKQAVAMSYSMLRKGKK